MQKVHKQFYHISVSELFRFVLPLFDKAEHAEIKRLINNVCSSCNACALHMKLAPKPSNQSKGLYAKHVNDIICAETFFVDGIAIIHFMDIFSGLSMLVIEGQTDTRPALVENPSTNGS